MKLPKYSRLPKKLKAPLLIRRVVGHSMLPVLPPGTRVIGRRYYKRLKIGQVVVVLHESKEKIKRIDQIKDSQIYVTGDHVSGSTDSRDFGWLNQDTVLAVIIWPRAKKIIIPDNR